MPDRLRQLAEVSFQNLISNDEVQLISEADELHIAADEWTLVITGDPVTDALIVLENEDGTPESMLRAVINEHAFAAMRDLDEQLEGGLTSSLAHSPDEVAQALAQVLDA